VVGGGGMHEWGEGQGWAGGGMCEWGEVSGG